MRELRDAMHHLRAVDTLVVWRLDRLGRSPKHLIGKADRLRTQGIGLKSLKEAIDTESSTGQPVFRVFGALAEFERAVIRERAQAGLASARARGRRGGRRKARGRHSAVTRCRGTGPGSTTVLGISECWTNP